MPFLVFLRDHLPSTSIICGSIWGSFAVGDYLLCCTDRLYLDAAREAAQDQKSWGEIVDG